MQHVVLTPLTYPGSCKTCFSGKPVFGGKISLIFPIIYQIVDQNIALWSLPTGAWMPELSSFNWFGGKNEQFSQFAHRFDWDKTCLYFEFLSTLSTYKLHWNYSISWSDHAYTSLLDDCAWGTHGVQLPNWSDPGQVRAIRFRRVWVSWHPSI